MIDVIVVTHSDVATHLIQAAERVLGQQKNVIGLNLSLEDSLEFLTAKIGDAITQCSRRSKEACDGVLILTDLFGSTPTNASLAQMRCIPQQIEILTGVNLPMMISALAYRNKLGLKDLADKVAADGQKGIRNAKAVLLSKLGS